MILRGASKALLPFTPHSNNESNGILVAVAQADRPGVQPQTFGHPFCFTMQVNVWCPHIIPYNFHFDGTCLAHPGSEGFAYRFLGREANGQRSDIITDLFQLARGIETLFEALPMAIHGALKSFDFDDVDACC